MDVTRRFEFDAGHRLSQHLGKCRNLHGHRYIAELTVSTATELGPDQMVIDFGVLKKRIGEWIDKHWDHGMVLDADDKYWVKTIEAAGLKLYCMQGPPTAENMAHELVHVAKRLLVDMEVRVTKIRLYETPNCWAEAAPL